MDSIFGKSFYPLFVPFLLICTGIAMLSYIHNMPEFFFDILDFLPYAIACMGTALAWWFNSSRAVFALVMVTAGYALLWAFFPGGVENDNFGTIVYSSYCLLLPINMLVFSFLEERGILTAPGSMRIGALAIQFVIVFTIITGGMGVLDNQATAMMQETVSSWLSQKVFSYPAENITFIPQLSLIVFVIALLIFAIKTAISAMPLDSGFLGACAAVGAGLHFVDESFGPATFFCLAAIMITISVIQDSYRMAFIDELTALPGRRALVNDMKKLGNRYTIAMVDIDFFKKFNDKYGHDVGDQVLRMVASRLEGVTGGGKAYRYGGEEFTILFPGKRLEVTTDSLEEVRKVIEESIFVLRSKDRPEEKPKKSAKSKSSSKKSKNKNLSITVSIGAAEKQSKNEASDDIIIKADRALYKAKKNGRNKVAY